MREYRRACTDLLGTYGGKECFGKEFRPRSSYYVFPVYHDDNGWHRMLVFMAFVCHRGLATRVYCVGGGASRDGNYCGSDRVMYSGHLFM